MEFRFRSNEKEYLDGSDIEPEDLYQNLRELDVINQKLGGYNASRKGLADILNTNKSVSTVLDIGFGGGDSIKQLSKFSDEKNTKLFFLRSRSEK